MAHHSLFQSAGLFSLALACVPSCAWAQTVAVTIGSSSESGRQFSVAGTGCSPGPAYTTPQALQWTPGASCTVTFVSPHSLTTDRRYVFSTWNDGVASNPRVFTAPSQATSYNAIFNAEYRLTVQVSPTGGGTVSAPEWAFPDTQPSLVATPAAGYRFVRWGNVDEQLGNTAKVRMWSSGRTVTAHFAASSTAMSSGYTVVPVSSNSYNTPLLNAYGQVVASNYDLVDLWTPETPNAISGTLARIPVSYVRAMNGRGQVLGGATPYALWSPAEPNAATGTMTTITLPANPTDLNDYGEIGGPGYLWIPTVAGGSAGSTVQNTRFSGLTDINNQGQAVMFTTSYVSGKTVRTVTLFTPSAARTGSGTFVDLPSPVSGSFQTVAAINNGGAIVGTACMSTACNEVPLFIWRPSTPNAMTGTLEIVNPPAGFTKMTPTSMNDKGDVVGTMSLAGWDYSYIPFLYTGGVVYDLTTADQLFSDIQKLTINNAGQIVFSSGNYTRLATPAPLNPAPAPNAVPVTLQSVQDGRVFSVSGTGCQPGTYGAPRTLLWNPGASCTVSFASPHALSSTARQLFLSWQDGVTSNPRVFTTPAQASTFTATFNWQYLLSAEVIPAGGGTVSGTGWMTQNGNTTLKATPAAGFRFVEWIYQYNTSISDTLVISTYGAQTVKAVFTPLTTTPTRQYVVIPVAAVSSSSAINDYGQIAGAPDYGSSAFLWTPSSANGIAGALSSFPSLSGVPEPTSLQINGRGQVAGRRSDSRPFLWSPTAANAAAGTTVALADVPLNPTTMNDYGQVAGNGWVWTPSAANGSTGTLVQNNSWSVVAGMNEAGQMLISNSSGWRLFTPSSRGASTGTYTEIGAPAGPAPAMTAVNSAGHVTGNVCVGADSYNCPRRVFVSNPAAGISSFSTIAAPAGIDSMVAWAINDNGDMVGAMRPPSGTSLPFLYTNGAVYDLTTVNALLRGGTATDINNAGQIVVTANSLVYLVSPLGVAPPPPPPPPNITMTLSHSEAQFGAMVGATATGERQVQVTLSGTNAASTAWSATSNQQWVTLTPASGTGSGQFVLKISGAPTATAGTLEATITVTAGNATKTLRVVLTITAASATKPPFGVVDLPANNANVSGAIGVTGWALDDTEVVRIEVWRRAVPGEPHMNGQVYIGVGIFVDGARPDVANANPGVPFNTRGGWGMQVLTNMLPNASGAGPLGNGQHQLFVYAIDREGKSTLLGSRFINVNNATATKPFGTIATPASGGTASGVYTNFGWALTPQPAMIPFDGSTMWVFVDGVSQGHPTYNQYRADIATLFPGLQNSNGGVGYYHLDTTRLANGMHSIAWSVTDNLNRIEGIGSRLFFVQNPGGAAAASSGGASSKTLRSSAREGVWFRAGYDPNASLQKLEGNVIEVEHGGRIELHVGGATLVEFDGNASLPVGSTFDDGVFYWQLDTAYIASYELKFRDADGIEISRIAVRVN